MGKKRQKPMRKRNSLLCFKTADSSDDDDNGELHQGLIVGYDVIDDDVYEESYYDYEAKQCCQFSRELKKDLSDFVDTDFGLLEKLRAALTDRLYDSLVKCKGYERYDKLMVICGYAINKDDFFKALQATSQQHIINFINQRQKKLDVNFDRKCFPLTEAQRRILKDNMYDLAQLIAVDDLLPEICAAGCITYVHRNYIKEVSPITYERSACLLEILLRRSQVDYENVSNALDGIGQSHLARVLREGGGILQLHAELSVPCAAAVEVQLETNFEEWKRQPETKFNEWLAMASPEAREAISNKWHELGGEAFLASIMEMKKSNSVAVFIHCMTLSAVQCLDQALKDGKLKFVMEAVFSSILPSGIRCEIRELHCSVNSYNSCLNLFYSSQGCYDSYALLPRDYFVRDDIEQLQPAKQHNLLLINLPWELCEELLVRSAVLIFKQLIKFTSLNADRLAIVTLLMVCHHWRLVLTERTFIKQRIKRYFDYLCQPFVRKFRHKASLTLTKKDGSKLDRQVEGVAMLDNEVFVVSFLTSTVSVFDATSFNCQQHIEVKGLVLPQDIATCALTRRVYISDNDSDCVWSIDWPPRSTTATATTTTGVAAAAAAVGDDSLKAMSSSFSARRFIVCEGYKPDALSVTFGHRRQQLLVIPSRGRGDDICNSLYVYDFDGKLLQRVQLPVTAVDDIEFKWWEIKHAVQVNTTVATTTDDSFVVSRFGSHLHPLVYVTHAEVVEYNTRGERVRCYYSGLRGEGSQQVHWPGQMALIGDGRLLVTDENAGRVLLLNADLKLERVLLTEQQLNGGEPNKLCYNPQNGLLFVGMNSPDGRVEVYQIH